jgi:serine/threonine protein kinase
VFARKIIRLYADVQEKDIKNEIRAVVLLCMSHNPHKNIISVFDCGCLLAPCYYIDMELCGYNLEVWIRRQRDHEKAENVASTTTEESRMAQIREIMLDIIGGVIYIHSQKQTHRDLKPRNGITSFTYFYIN